VSITHAIGDLAQEFDHGTLSRVLERGRSTGAGFSEIFVEEVRRTAANLDDGTVESVSSSRDFGAGIRVISGDTTGYAHTTDLTEPGLLAAAEAAARAASRGDGGKHVVALGTPRRQVVNTVRVVPASVPKARKIELLMLANDAARAADSSIVQVSAGYGDTTRRILVANSDGVLASDEQVRTLFRLNAVANGDTGLQTGYDSLGHTVGFELFDEESVEELARRAAQRAVTKLHARPAPSGAVPVVIKQGSGGVLFHEACGHGLEADLVARGASVYANRVGELVASPLVTLVDDGTMSREWGAIGIDDEGHPSQRNVLIENGVLTDYMWDHIRATREGRAPSGNGRRESYEYLPMVRMTNTFVMNGTESPDDIIRATDHGVYVAKLGGGQVNTATGDFVFGMTEAYLIENGEITEPLRESNLIGNGPQVLADIDLLGNDFAMGNPGTCGKDGQGVPVGDGQPTLRVKSLTIGGTAA
jgi:TldD protein